VGLQLRAQAVQLTHLLVNLGDAVLKGLDHLPDAQAPVRNAGSCSAMAGKEKPALRDMAMKTTSRRCAGS
jgi:hypothetical protein